jgi:plasmid maintenance system antidote protein VapI
VVEPRPDTAWLFAQAFDTTPEFWLNLQAMHDLARMKPKRRIRRLMKVG